MVDIQGISRYCRGGLKDQRTSFNLRICVKKGKTISDPAFDF